MKKFSSIKATRLWVLALLLAFTTQVFSLSVHASMMIQVPESYDHAMSDCHGNDDPIELEIFSSMSNEAIESCCDGDCSMMGCQAIFAMLNSVFVSPLTLSLSVSYFELSVATLKRHNSLFRPPILG